MAHRRRAGSPRGFISARVGPAAGGRSRGGALASGTACPRSWCHRRDQLQVGYAVEEAVQHRLRFDPVPGAFRDSCGSRLRTRCPPPRSVDVERARVGPSRFVTVGRADTEVDLRALRDRYAVDLHVLVCVARHPDQRRLVAQPLFDRGRNEVAILLQCLELVGMGQQEVQQIARRPIGGLQPGGKQQRRNEMIASSVSFSPSISAATRSPMMSSVIVLRRWST